MHRLPLRTFARYKLLFAQLLKLTPDDRPAEQAGLQKVLDNLKEVEANAMTVATALQVGCRCCSNCSGMAW